ncbi:hypothetical protein OWM54_29635 [Myxococcus sp. MISCRS1]|jgi:hypothetical protein|uniref:hypothetical protein n=1 Tax=Myxococcus TaxID=32 RepID=UPI001CBBD355|nr:MULTISPECIES: hypothetical protein [unclassified Myxococcus]MBZ4394352.1 hypothetical protein [Myxococcus sp. AS-1-15]MBZ4410446.1 hypothetical protein [Myxococcus sp. XM-1-1-1]MCY1001319.1 hypothetical protein [Myxococcus sp. MISCRS1]BDT37109.1 hypothetical protein MFMH1_67780 [Myxococcus sp. MH1]
MSYPPRLAHLATRAVVVAKLVPTYAQAHRLDEEEAAQRLTSAMSGRMLAALLDAAWTAMRGKTKRLTDDGLLEKVAGTLSERPLRPGRVAEVTPAWSAFLVLTDLEAGTASDAARRVMETEEGRRRGDEGMAEAGRFLAAELTRGK